MNRYFPYMRMSNVLAIAGLVSCACSKTKSDGAAGDSIDGGKDAGSVLSRDGGDGAVHSKPTLYALANEIYTDDDSTTYVNVLTSLDMDELDYSKGIEYGGGRATIATNNGYLFVAGPENPLIERFEVSDEGKVTKDGELSFAKYGIEYVTLDEWGNTFISETKAYLFNATDGSTIIWNPNTMKIVGEVEQEGVELVRDLGDINGSAGVVKGNRLFRTVFWSNWDDWKTSREQYLAVYDTDTDKLIAFEEEARCPGLGNRVDSDEDGNLYFSNWIWNVPETLLSNAPKSCALRILKDEERFDPSWTLPFANLTEGREAGVLAYLGQNKGLLSVFHDERAEINDMTVPNELASTDNWRIWLVDLKKQSGGPLAGLSWMAGAASTYHIDDRSFVLVPSDGWTRVKVYEVENDRAKLKFGIDGWTYSFFKIR